MKQTFSVSIVIPVYNEAAHLPACLDAIAEQTVRPYEVIVVDNNSTDDTVDIARGYDFVTVIHEKRQGVVYARDRGFNAAQGDIIGRIDADSIIEPQWVEKVAAILADGNEDAITGRIRYYDIARADYVNAVDLYFRRYFARKLGREVAVQGSNMALTRKAWKAVRTHVCYEPGLHEDFDLAVHLNEIGKRVAYDESFSAGIGFRQTDSTWRQFANYALTSPRTYAYHGLKSQRCMYPVVVLAVVCYVPLRLLHRGYDPVTDRFSLLACLRNVTPARVNPATYGDY